VTSGDRLVLGTSLRLLPGEDGTSSGAVAVLRPLADAAVEFVAQGEGYSSSPATYSTSPNEDTAK
jgi:hypothetical protein